MAAPKDRLDLPVPSNLHDYGAIGNLHSVALVSRHGSIDWLCWPRFASPSLLARILDVSEGGYLAIRPEEPSTSRQRYLPSTNVLETRFELTDGRGLTLTDFMPVEPSVHEPRWPQLIRWIEATGGPVTVQGVVAPRFNYGEEAPRWSPGVGGWVGRARSGAVWAGMPCAASTEDGVLRGEWTVTPGTGCSVELVWGERRPDRESAEVLRDQAVDFWTRWCNGSRTRLHQLAGGWRGILERSELVLKLLAHARTGAFVAAPTTSLPEWPGGERNWDYRYVWIRDAALSAQILVTLGHLEEADAYLRWVTDRLRCVGSQPLRVLYGAHGETDLKERTIPRFRGFLDSRPVRIGNTAADQFQLDIFGELLDAAAALVRVNPAIRQEVWPSFRPVAELIERRWKEPDRSIWEIRGPPNHYVHSKVMAWVGLDRAALLSHAVGDDDEAQRWREAARTIRESVLTHGIDERSGALVQSYGRRGPDAANLRIPMVGFLPFDDPRIRATIDRVESELADGPFVHRYRGGDGIEGPEGAFLPCGFWLATCLARTGQIDRARRRFEGLMEAANPLGLLSEEYDPRGRIPLGNFPQAFSHIALLWSVEAIVDTAPPGSISQSQTV